MDDSRSERFDDHLERRTREERARPVDSEESAEQASRASQARRPNQEPERDARAGRSRSREEEEGSATGEIDEEVANDAADSDVSKVADANSPSDDADDSGDSEAPADAGAAELPGTTEPLPEIGPAVLSKPVAQAQESPSLGGAPLGENAEGLSTQGQVLADSAGAGTGGAAAAAPGVVASASASAPQAGVPADAAASQPLANAPAGDASAAGSKGGAESASRSAQAAPQQAEAVARAEAILGQVRMKLVPDLRRATLHLEPAELGRLAIEIEVKDGAVRAELRVESAETLAALERHLPELRALFAQADLEVSDLQLLLDDGGGFPGSGEEASSERSGTSAGGDAPHNEDELLDPRLTQALASDAGVDLMA